MHMNEHGTTISSGNIKENIKSHKVLWEGKSEKYWPNHYTNAIYSDDGGKFGIPTTLSCLWHW